MQYGNIILHCELRRLKSIIKMDFFNLSFTVDVTSRLNDLNLKLPGKDKLIHRLVNDISPFKMKFKPLISQ